jgi:hypothetical protein
MKTITRQLSGRGLSMLLLAASSAALAEAPAPDGAGTSLGTLEYGPTIYYPQGCNHNGSTVVCTFVFVHQAETATIRAGGGGSQLTGIQFVDDAHVPHAPNNAYFVDRYGMRQHLLTVNRADQGTMLVEFPLVDPRVSSGELHLGSQVLGGIPVAQGGGERSPGAPNALAVGGQAQTPAMRQASAAGRQASAAGAAGGGAGSDPCSTPQMAKTSGCKMQAKGQAYATQATATANGVKSMTDAASQIGAMFGFKKPAPAPAQPSPQPAGNQ